MIVRLTNQIKTYSEFESKPEASPDCEDSEKEKDSNYRELIIAEEISRAVATISIVSDEMDSGEEFEWEEEEDSVRAVSTSLAEHRRQHHRHHNPHHHHHRHRHHRHHRDHDDVEDGEQESRREGNPNSIPMNEPSSEYKSILDAVGDDLAFDEHSSEEELEVINSSSHDEMIDEEDASLPADEEKDLLRCDSEVLIEKERMGSAVSSSSEDELNSAPTPVEFCASPRPDLHKPPRLFQPFPGVDQQLQLVFNVGAYPITAANGSGDAGRGATSPRNHTIQSASLSGNGGFNPLLVKKNDLIVAAATIASSTNINNDNDENMARLLGTDMEFGRVQGCAAQEDTASEQSDEAVQGNTGAVPMNAGSAHLNHHHHNVHYHNHHHHYHHHHDSNSSVHHKNRCCTSPALALISNNSSNARRSKVSSSLRKRSRTSHHHPRHIKRPWLDFEKMQQFHCGLVG